MQTTTQFTEQQQERFFTLIETGRLVTEACEDADISRNTIYRWLRKGKEADADPKYVEFVRRYEEIKERESEMRLSKTDLVRLLERSAINGSVVAAKALLERPWDRKVVSDAPVKKEPISKMDELAARRNAR